MTESWRDAATWSADDLDATAAALTPLRPPPFPGDGPTRVDRQCVQCGRLLPPGASHTEMLRWDFWPGPSEDGGTVVRMRCDVCNGRRARAERGHVDRLRKAVTARIVAAALGVPDEVVQNRFPQLDSRI